MKPKQYGFSVDIEKPDDMAMVMGMLADQMHRSIQALLDDGNSQGHPLHFPVRLSWKCSEIKQVEHEWKEKLECSECGYKPTRRTPP